MADDEERSQSGTVVAVPAEDVVLPVEAEETAEEVPVPKAPLAKQYPTLEEYQEKWARDLALHSRPIASAFSLDCLVPRPIANLWQDLLKI